MERIVSVRSADGDGTDPAVARIASGCGEDGGECYPLDPARLARAKAAFTTRHFDPARARLLLRGDGVVPRAGDLLLARVAVLGQHHRLELVSGRRAALQEDDEVLVVYGDRYASDQFEAQVPEDLGPCQLIAAGGLAGRCRSRHAGTRRPTELVPVGLLAGADGRRLSTLDLAPLRPADDRPPVRRPPVFAVLGSAMNAGKTTVAAALVRGWSRCGVAVGVFKATGTGSGGDRFACLDAGAAHVLDFSDYGHPSTHRLPPERLRTLFVAGIAELVRRGAERIVVEIADGILFAETAQLVAEPVFRQLVDGVLFAAIDALGALAGIQRLQAAGLPVLAASGLMTASPLAVRELEAALSVPVVEPERMRRALWLPVPHHRPAGRKAATAAGTIVA